MPERQLAGRLGDGNEEGVEAVQANMRVPPVDRFATNSTHTRLTFTRLCSLKVHGASEERLALVTFAMRWSLIDALDAGRIKIHWDEEVSSCQPKTRVELGLG